MKNILLGVLFHGSAHLVYLCYTKFVLLNYYKTMLGGRNGVGMRKSSPRSEFNMFLISYISSLYYTDLLMFKSHFAWLLTPYPYRRKYYRPPHLLKIYTTRSASATISTTISSSTDKTMLQFRNNGEYTLRYTLFSSAVHIFLVSTHCN